MPDEPATNPRSANTGPGNDGAFAHICFVRFNGTGPWQAESGEWILFQARLFPGLQVFLSLTACTIFAAGVTGTLTLQGSPVSAEKQCKLAAPSVWAFSVEFLSHPLAAGTYTASSEATTPQGSFFDQETLTVG